MELKELMLVGLSVGNDESFFRLVELELSFMLQGREFDRSIGSV